MLKHYKTCFVIDYKYLLTEALYCPSKKCKKNLDNALFENN